MVQRYSYSVSDKGSPPQYLDDRLRGCRSSHPHLLRTSTRTCLTFLSNLITALPYIRLSHLARERSRQLCSLETIPCTTVDVGRRSASENVIHANSQSRSVCDEPQDSWSPTGVRPLDAEEISPRAAYHHITNSIHLLKSHTSTIARCGVPGSRAIGKESRLHILEISGCSHSYPCISLYTSLGTPRLLHLRSVPLTY